MPELSHELPRSGLRGPARPPLLGRLIGRTLRVAYRLARRDRYDDFRLEWLDGMPLMVIPSVFNPKLLRTGAFLAAQIDAQLLHPQQRVLDMGTGSGVCAVRAARRAQRVLAVDLNPAAVRCARINALLNQVEARLEVRQGDLFAPLAGERFDLILFNPPFLRGEPRDERERAWRAGDVAQRFAAGLRQHLRPGGCALLLLSSFGDAGAFLAPLQRHGLNVTALSERRFVNEHLVIYRVSAAAEEP
jgi:release factor glutamine methyltransferase